MTYTKQVREYCLKNQGAVLDVSLVKDGEFSEIPYKTLLKILNRLEEEKLIFGILKGVYAIGKLNVQDEPDISLTTVMGNVIDNKPFEDDFGIIHCDEGIDLMPCNVELSGIESYLFPVMSRECIMRTYVNQIKKNYDYTEYHNIRKDAV